MNFFNRLWFSNTFFFLYTSSVGFSKSHQRPSQRPLPRAVSLAVTLVALPLSYASWPAVLPRLHSHFVMAAAGLISTGLGTTGGCCVACLLGGGAGVRMTLFPAGSLVPWLAAVIDALLHLRNEEPWSHPEGRQREMYVCRCLPRLIWYQPSSLPDWGSQPNPRVCKV